MTLRQALRNLEPESKIKVGAINGTAWFYIGTNDDLERGFADYDAALMRMWKKKLKNAKDSLKVLLTVTVTIESYVMSQIRRSGTPEFTIEGYKAHIEECLRNVRYLHHQMQRCQDIINNPVPLSMRPVVDTYKATLKEEKGYTLIRIEGFEPGVFWTSGEADSLPCMKFNLTDAEERAEEYGEEI